MVINIQQKLFKLFRLHNLYWDKRPNGIYSFNFHRIGNKEDTAFDPNVFSCNERRFKQLIAFFQQNFDVITAKELSALIKAGNAHKGRYAILTFDDGYIDNYTIAYPILKRYHCPAIMYIATDFINQSIIPWWDESAWLVKNNDSELFSALNWNLPGDINTLPTAQKIKQLLLAIKKERRLTIEQKMAILRQNAQHTFNVKSNTESLFMTWGMLREMASNNIDIGSQTCSHPILSHLSESAQFTEISQSKAILEAELKQPIMSFAYPVGGVDSFTTATQSLVKQAGYHFAMSFISGINIIPEENIYSLNRFSIDNQCSPSDIKSNIIRSITAA